MYCLFCHREVKERHENGFHIVPTPCGNFCDDTCKREYADEQEVRIDQLKEELPGESQYQPDYEPEEWDVVGGL